jgi:outer membrane lipoprotein-sorting protein
MKISVALLLTLSCLLLLACSPDNTPPAKLFEEQRSALDKAKAVEETVQQQNQNMQQNLEKQTQ